MCRLKRQNCRKQQMDLVSALLHHPVSRSRLAPEVRSLECQHQYQPPLQQQKVSRMVGKASGLMLNEVKQIKNAKQKSPTQTNMIQQGRAG